MPLCILHTSPPSFAISWQNGIQFTATNDLHIHAPSMTDLEREELLRTILETATESQNVYLYTGISTSDYHAPCGCTGYDNVCDYHRYYEPVVAECYCSKEYGTLCSYHTM